MEINETNLFMKTRLSLKLLLLLCLLVAGTGTSGAQDRDYVILKTKKVFKQKKKLHRVSLNITYLEEDTGIEPYACRYLFNDTVHTVLTDAVSAYLSTMGEETESAGSKKYDSETLYSLEVVTQHPGKYTCYFICREHIQYEKGLKKSRTKQRNLIYDEVNHRILKVEDVFAPQEAAHIKQLANTSSVDMLMNDDLLMLGYQKNGKLVEQRDYNFDRDFRMFNGKFLSLVGKDSLQMEHDRAQKLKDTTAALVSGEKLVTAVETGEKVFDVVEQMPAFPGGQAALIKWISENVKYPSIAEENGIQGRVVCSFVVERDGSVTDVKVVRSIDPSIDKEAVRVLKKMPRWNPGRQGGSPVRVKYTVPVTFRLGAPVQKVTNPFRFMNR